jgi:hypothetical protein
VASMWHSIFKHSMIFMISMFMMSYRMISSNSGGLGMANSRLLYLYVMLLYVMNPLLFVCYLVNIGKAMKTYSSSDAKNAMGSIRSHPL